MIKSERIYLKPIGENDIEWLRETRNKYKNNFFDANEISKEQQRSWYERYQENSTDRMFIIKLKSGEYIGTIALYNIDIGSRKAVLGRVLLLEEFRGHGYAEEAVKLLTDYAFSIMKLYKIKVEVHQDNLDALAIYARAGFKTITRPIMVLEKTNYDFDARKPLKIESYDELSETGYESQESNIK